MNSLILDISAVVIAIAISYGVFWFKNHKTKIDKQVEEGNALAFTIDILGKMVTNFVYDLKDDNEKGANKKKDVMVKVKTALADAKLPIPSDAEISGAIEKAVTTMKLAEKQGGK
ncbi:phage holin [Lactobacillus sp. PSON]|uniref:phage holin n=1 Tax=Lactobacillus sp. PSON TaxID=3455454 RepID=UPI0040410CC5